MKSRSRKNKAGKLSSNLTRVNPDSAGIDIGSASHFVAVPPGRDEKPVREFKSFTSDLYELADWLEYCGIKTVAMESTGVYWIPLFEILETRGFEVLLVNPKHLKMYLDAAKVMSWIVSGFKNSIASDCYPAPFAQKSKFVNYGHTPDKGMG